MLSLPKISRQFYFLPSVGLLVLSCGPTPTTTVAPSPIDCMQAIIAADDSLGRVRNHACELTSLYLTIQSYADELEALDFRACPAAFKQGFSQHILAWQQLLPLVAPYDSLRGEMHDLFAQIEQSTDSTNFKAGVAQVWSTWALIEEAIEE